MGQTVHSSVLATTNKLNVQMAYIIQNYSRAFSKSESKTRKDETYFKRMGIVFAVNADKNYS